MILKECLDSKCAAQKLHYAQTGGDPVSYAELLRKKYKETLKRRGVRSGASVLSEKLNRDLSE